MENSSGFFLRALLHKISAPISNLKLLICKLTRGERIFINRLTCDMNFEITLCHLSSISPRSVCVIFIGWS